MRTILFTLCVIAFSCKRNPHPDKAELERLVGVPVEKILLQKKYQLDHTRSLEDITLFEASGKAQLVVLTPEGKSYRLLRRFDFGKQLEEPKIFFIAIGNKRSHILLVHGSEKKHVLLFDATDFVQEFAPDAFDTTTVKISKSESKAQDEILELGKDKYRFNGMRWILWQGDEIFLHLDTFEATGEQGLIEISNRGEFGSRVLVSLGFPDITAKDMAQKIKLTKDIPTVRLYPPGTPVHKNGGGQIRLHYPLLEIRKDTLNKNGKIRLPLFLQDARQLYLRAVYYQRGKLVHWPSNSGAGIAKDGQDYFAVVR